MAVTKEQVLDEAKKLGITLNDKQVDAFVLIGVLPQKEGTGTPPEGDDDDLTDEEKEKMEKSKVIRDRINKEKEKRKALQRELDDANAKVKAAEEAQKGKERTDAEAKGQYEKVKADAEAAKSKYDTGLVKIMEDFKNTVVKGKVETELLAAGVPRDRLAKAVKAFEMDHADKVSFEWTDKEKYAYEMDEEAITEAVKTFKSENGYFFAEREEEEEGFVPRRTGNVPSSKGGGDAAKRAEELKKKHSRLFV